MAMWLGASTGAIPKISAMGIPEYTFSNIEGLRRYVAVNGKALDEGGSKAQYHAVHGVPASVFDEIDGTGLAGARLRYDHDKSDLIIKLMPSLRHDAAHLILIKAIETRVLRMGLDEYKLYPTGSTMYKGNSGAKQGDSGVKPVPEREKESDWPTLVVECGVSENIRELQADSNWWLTNSKGDVKIVILVLVNLEGRTLAIEKRQLVADSTSPSTRIWSTQEFRAPAATARVDVSWDVTGTDFVVSGPLTIEFESILLRPSVPPEEDLVFTRQDLGKLAKMILSGLQQRPGTNAGH